MSTLSTPFWCLCQKLSLSPLYFKKTLLHKGSERSSLISGPGLSSSPPGARIPVSWYNNNLSKLWKILKEVGTPDHLICLLRNLCAGQEASVRTGHGITDWFQIEKGVLQGCQAAYLTYTQSTSYNMPGWMKHKLESRLQGEISTTLDTQITPPLW